MRWLWLDRRLADVQYGILSRIQSTEDAMSSVVSIRTDSDLLSQLTTLAAIQKAVQEADAGDFATSDEVAAMDAKWNYHAD